MNEQETKPMAETTADSVQETATTTTSPASESADTSAGSGKSKVVAYVIAGIVVLAILLGTLYLMEKEGRSETNVFGWLIESQQANAVVATVNGTDITGSDLSASIEQFTQVAASQGADVNDPNVQSEIRTQALEVLVNTELLKQAAAEAGLSVSEAEAQARLDEITEGIGGQEVLEERMAELGVDSEKLLQDIREELLIEQYLDQLFVETDVEVTEEDVQAFYDNAGGVEAGLPALEEVREQIEEQLAAGQEQAIIDEALAELRAEGEVEISE